MLNLKEKQKITLHQKIATIDEFKEMIKSNDFPLMIVLDEVDQELYIKSSKMQSLLPVCEILREKYYDTCLINDGSSNRYIVFDIGELGKEDNKVLIKYFIDLEGNKKKVDGIYYPLTVDGHLSIGIKEKATILEPSKVKKYSFLDLVFETSKKYIGKQEKQKKK